MKLIAFMFRARTEPRTDAAGPLVRWHLHGGCALPGHGEPGNITVHDPRCPQGQLLHYSATMMLHVWLTTKLSHAFAMDAPRELLHPTA
jgi:hypothetical protein